MSRFSEKNNPPSDLNAAEQELLKSSGSPLEVILALTALGAELAKEMPHEDSRGWFERVRKFPLPSLPFSRLRGRKGHRPR